ncbi:MAG: DNA adenine methylase [Caldilineaceae bacterium]|nr:DNA adenine methylase [Caldilineaceae bacterium]
MTLQLSLFDLPITEDVNTPADASQQVVNVASVPMRSPFRYAGGKTWLIPRIRAWLRERGGKDKELIELFAGGGIVSLTAVFEKLVGCATMVELDEDVAAVWETITNGNAQWLADKIVTFNLTPETARHAIDQADKSLKQRAFATIVKNRVNRGGILADGASFVKHGENGKGIRSRWYPETLKRRILDIDLVRDRIHFIHGDAFEVCRKHGHRTNVVYFIDPPYVKAGRRLYRHSDMDHTALFAQAAELAGDFLMTYDNAPEIRHLAEKHGFDMREVAMKTTHHDQKTELLIGRNLDWVA